MKQSAQNILIVIVWLAHLLPTNRAQMYYDTNHVSTVGVGAILVYTNSYNAGGLIELAKANGSLTNLVNLLVTSGEFCRVRGHVWSYVTTDIKAEGGFVPAVYSIPSLEPTQHRQCSVCGTNQYRSMPPWPGAEAATAPGFTNLYLGVTNIYWDDTLKKYLPLNDFV